MKPLCFVDHLNYLCYPQHMIWAATCDFQQCGILTSVDSDKPVQPPFKLRNWKWCPISSLTLIENSSDKQRLWSDCMYAQADPRLCLSHIPHCWKSHAMAHFFIRNWFLLLLFSPNFSILSTQKSQIWQGMFSQNIWMRPCFMLDLPCWVIIPGRQQSKMLLTWMWIKIC